MCIYLILFASLILICNKTSNLLSCALIYLCSWLSSSEWEIMFISKYHSPSLVFPKNIMANRFFLFYIPNTLLHSNHMTLLFGFQHKKLLLWGEFPGLFAYYLDVYHQRICNFLFLFHISTHNMYHLVCDTFVFPLANIVSKWYLRTKTREKQSSTTYKA